MESGNTDMGYELNEDLKSISPGRVRLGVVDFWFKLLCQDLESFALIE